MSQLKSLLATVVLGASLAIKAMPLEEELYRDQGGEVAKVDCAELAALIDNKIIEVKKRFSIEDDNLIFVYGEERSFFIGDEAFARSYDALKSRCNACCQDEEGEKSYVALSKILENIERSKKALEHCTKTCPNDSQNALATLKNLNDILLTLNQCRHLQEKARKDYENSKLAREKEAQRKQKLEAYIAAHSK